MGSFKEMTEPEQAFLRMAIYGFSGTAKTPTAAKIAIGLAKHIGADRVAFFDTESQGSDFVLPLFKESGIRLFVRKSRAFSELIRSVREIKGDIPILIVDSLSLAWKELQDTYCKTKRVSDIEFQDWRKIKGPGYWQDWVEEYLSAPIHQIAVGRASTAYEDRVNPKNGKIQKVALDDPKMKAEREFQFEPSLVFLMDRNPDTNVAEAYVSRDRCMGPQSLTGKTFPDPKFEDILPHINFLRLGSKQGAVDKMTSESIIENDAENQFNQNERRRRDVALDEIKSYITKIAPGQSAGEKAVKTAIVELAFDTPAWAKVETMDVKTLEKAARMIRELAKGGQMTDIKLIKAAWAGIEQDEKARETIDIPM